MKQINWMHFFLVGLVGLTAAARPPLEIPISVEREGCIPFSPGVCPSHMACLVNFNYPKFGYCACQNDFGMITRPPIPLEPGSELGKPAHRDDCISGGIPSAITGFFWFGYCILCANLAYSSGCLLREVIKNGGLSKNSSCAALILIFIMSTTRIPKYMIVGLKYFKIDEDSWMYDTFFPPFDTINCICYVVMNMECNITWFDLYQKSTTMSKRSSVFISFLRVVLRSYAVLITFSLTGERFGLYERNSDIMLYIIATLSNVLAAVNLIAAPLISRLLCKDMRDVTNPNWKAAAAILSTGIYGAIGPFMFYAGYAFYVATSIYSFQVPFIGASAYNIMFGSSAINVWSWYQYCRFAHRKYSSDSTGSKLTQYFGFTTIGLKDSNASSIASGTSTTASSAASTTSSAVSSASVAASSSVEEGTGATTDGKGTMA